MLSQEIKKWDDRKFRLMLYPDDSTHVEAMEKIKASYDYAFILHDKDVYTEEDKKKNPNVIVGTLKKPHWHVVLSFRNARWNTALAKKLGITYNYIKECDRLNKALEYLIHYNEPEKYQYDIDEVYGPLKQKLKESINSTSKSEGDKVVELIEYINNYKGKIRFKDFSLYCAKNGYWADFRRSAAIFIRIIEEHNMYYN